MTIMIIDTETTGLFPRGCTDITKSVVWECCRMVQIAWRKYDETTDALVDKACYTIKPDGYVIPEVPAKIHGITTEIATDTGIPIRDFFKLFAEAIEDVTFVVAHNVRFDDTVIQSELYRYEQTELYTKWCKKEKKCTMIMGNEWRRGIIKKRQREATNDGASLTEFYNGKWMKLAELYKICFNKEPTEILHRADADVSICADIYFHMKNTKID